MRRLAVFFLLVLSASGQGAKPRSAALSAACQTTLRTRMEGALEVRAPPSLSPLARQRLAALRALLAGKPTEVRYLAKRRDDGAVVQLKREALFGGADGGVSAQVSVYLSADEDDAIGARPGFVSSSTLLEGGLPVFHLHDAATVTPRCTLEPGRTIATTIGAGARPEVLSRTALPNGSSFETIRQTSQEALAEAPFALRLIAGEPQAGPRSAVVFYGFELPEVAVRTEATTTVRLPDAWTGETSDFEVQQVELSRDGQPFFPFEVGRSLSSPAHYRRYPSLRQEEFRLPESRWKRLLLSVPEGSIVVEGFTRDDFASDALPLELTSPAALSFDNAAAYYELVGSEPLDGGVVSELVLRQAPGEARTFDAAPWLASTRYYPLEDPGVRRLAAAILERGASDRHELAQQVLDAVVERLTYDDSMAALNASQPISATEILQRSTGVCQHFAGLYVTLARAVGLPARQVNGLLLGSRGPASAGPHAWAEVSLDGKTWLPLEPQRATLGLSGVRYLPFGVADQYELGNPVQVPRERRGVLGERYRLRRLATH